MKKRRTYKIETMGDTITLYKRRWWCVWLPVEKHVCYYPQHAETIIRQWVRKYGIHNFIDEETNK